MVYIEEVILPKHRKALAMAKEINNTNRLLKVLRSAYNNANLDYCGGSLPQVEITFSSTRGAYGHFSVGEIWRSGDDTRHEININPDYVLSRPIEETIGTLLHEMAHLYASVNGIKDCSNHGVYHNKKFRDIGTDIFKLKIDHHDKYGWTITSPTEETLDFIIRHDIPDIKIGYDYGLGWLVGGGSGSSGGVSGGTPYTPPICPKPTKPKQSTRRYVCPSCGTIIRATRLVNVVCGDCTCQFVES